MSACASASGFQCRDACRYENWQEFIKALADETRAIEAMRERADDRQAFVLVQLVAHLRGVMDKLICDAQVGDAPMPCWRDWRRAESADGQP